MHMNSLNPQDGPMRRVIIRSSFRTEGEVKLLDVHREINVVLSLPAFHSNGEGCIVS